MVGIGRGEGANLHAQIVETIGAIIAAFMAGQDRPLRLALGQRAGWIMSGDMIGNLCRGLAIVAVDDR